MSAVNVVLLAFEVLDCGKGTLTLDWVASTDSVFVNVGVTTSTDGVGGATVRFNCSEVEGAAVLDSEADVDVDWLVLADSDRDSLLLSDSEA
jgi:hypothetical protein